MTNKLDRLKLQREKINQDIRRAENAERKQLRADNTRRKILDGALIQNYADTHPDMQALLDQLRHSDLTREDDRKLFGLDPLPQNDNKDPQTSAQDEKKTRG